MIKQIIFSGANPLDIAIIDDPEIWPIQGLTRIIKWKMEQGYKVTLVDRSGLEHDYKPIDTYA